LTDVSGVGVDVGGAFGADEERCSFEAVAGRTLPGARRAARETPPPLILVL